MHVFVYMCKVWGSRKYIYIVKVGRPLVSCPGIDHKLIKFLSALKLDDIYSIYTCN